MSKLETDQVGILSAEDIEAKLAELIIDGVSANVQPCSYDLRIGTVFRDGQIINASHSNAQEQVIVQPGEVVSIFTMEELKLPKDIAGTAFAMNRMSSRGFLILNPGHVDPGFEGPLTVKAINMRKVPLAISRGTEIFTVIFERMPKGTNQDFNNKRRDQREREYNAQSVEADAKDITELVVMRKDAPFPTRQETKEMIHNHWLSWLTLILALIAAAGSAVAVFQAS